mgnify:CR=1 FL=1
MLKVIRDGQLHQIVSNELTIGDLVYVEAGDVIEGDGRLIECANLTSERSA